MALIFDVDGVIVDSNPVHTQAWKEYLRRRGMQVENIERRMQGKHNDAIVQDFFGDDLSEREIAGHGAAKERLYREVMRPQLDRRLVPGIREFLETHRTFPLAVASNAEPENVEFVLNSSGLRRYFRVILNGHQVELPKPDPEIYLKAAGLLGIPPRNTIVFEDSPTGVEAARRAGARVVGVRTAHQDPPPVDFSIGDFYSTELESWLRDQKPQ